MLVPHQIGETTRGLGWDMSSAYSRALGSFFPMGSVGHTGFTGTSIWIDPREPRLRHHPDESRAPLRQGQCGRSASAGERGRGRRLLRAERPAAHCRPRAARDRRPRGRRRRAADRRHAHRARSARGTGLRAPGGPFGGAGDQPDRRGRAGPPDHRPPGRRAGRAPAGHLLARARHHRSARRERAARARRRHRASHLEPLRLRAPAVGIDDGGHRHVRLRHPGRGGPVLHLPDHPGLRPRGGSATRDSRDRARPAQPASRAAWSRGRSWTRTFGPSPRPTRSPSGRG